MKEARTQRVSFFAKYIAHLTKMVLLCTDDLWMDLAACNHTKKLLKRYLILLWRSASKHRTAFCVSPHLLS